MSFINIKKYKKRFVGYVKDRFATINETPVIVLGNQKSGTSAIAHLLADFGRLTKTIDIPPLWSPVAIKIMSGEINFVTIVKRYKSYFSTNLIKEPEMTFFADEVFKTFSHAKYVFVVRDPRDNIRSILNRMKIPGHLEEIDELSFFALKITYQPMLDAKIWGGNKSENYVCALAHKWNRAVDNYLQHKDRMILAKYEDFLADKYGFIAKIAQQLHIPEKANISDKLDVQYQPAGDRNISWEAFFGVENLKHIEHICSSRMKVFDYKECTQ